MSKRSKATDIPMKVKHIVWERDNHHCINCGSPYAMPNSHILSRAHSGLGIETNIVTMCLDCHHKYDNGIKKEKEKIKEKVVKYMKSIYGDDWSIEKQKYKKWSEK